MIPTNLKIPPRHFEQRVKERSVYKILYSPTYLVVISSAKLFLTDYTYIYTHNSQYANAKIPRIIPGTGIKVGIKGGERRED